MSVHCGRAGEIGDSVSKAKDQVGRQDERRGDDPLSLGLSGRWLGRRGGGRQLSQGPAGSSSHVGSHVVPFSASNVSWCPVPKLPNNDLDIRNYEILNG